MPAVTYRNNISIGGVTIRGTARREAEGQISQKLDSPALPAAYAGELTTRLGDDEGVLTLDNAEHDVEVNDLIDVFFAAGVRYGCPVTAVDGDEVTINGGAGAVLPAQGSDIDAAHQFPVVTAWPGSKTQIFALHSNRRAHFQVIGDGGYGSETVLAVELAAEEVFDWLSDQSDNNPLLGYDIEEIRVSNGNPTQTATPSIVALYDSVEE